MHCIAPWYELNLSAPDNNFSACCYSGERGAFNGGAFPLDYYWNSQSMRALRRLQSDPKPPIPNGCSNCFYFQNRPGGSSYADFAFDQTPTADITSAQLTNWRLAQREHAEGREEVECVPLRLYANFGYTCNLSCKMCHQVPRRKATDGVINADAIYAWENDLEKMLEICVIGGEPFALPECVKFIRRFAGDDRMDGVRLSVITNGTVLHKHLNILKNKRKMAFGVSLDSISGAYENIRIGSKWDIVERNMLMIKESIAKDRPEWQLSTSALIMKTGVPFLPEFARWHTKHGVRTIFFDFINFRGTEDAYYRENILDQPHLLDDVPGWEDKFEEAIDVFKAGSDFSAAASLQHFRERVLEARAKAGAGRTTDRQIKLRNDWSTAISFDGEEIATELTLHSGDPRRTPAFDPRVAPLRFSDTRPGDIACSKWIGLNAHSGSVYRLTVEWPKEEGEARQAHVVAQSQEGDLDGFREYKETPTSLSLTMTGMLAQGVNQVRVAVLPVGEEESIFPRHISLELDRETSHHIGCGVPIAPPVEEAITRDYPSLSALGFLAFVARRSREFGRTVSSLVRR